MNALASTSIDMRRPHGSPNSPGSNDPERCADALLDALTARAGLVGAELDTTRGALTLDYDPAVIPAPEADALASQLTQSLEGRYQACPNKLAGRECDVCVDSLQEDLRRRGGAAVGFTALPGRVALEAVAAPVVRAQVTRHLPAEPADTSVRRGWPWQRWEQTRWEATLTAIAGLGIAAGWIGGALGMTHQQQVACYMVAYVTAGYFGLRAGMDDLRQRIINVDLLMVMAAIGAALIGAWREGAILLFLFSLSNTLQGYAMGRSRQAIEALMQLRPDVALVRRGDREVLVRVEQLRLGDVVIVKPGERLPIDGLVRLGQSSVDQSTITGESAPVDIAPGSQVFAGTLNQGGALEIEVTRLASESTLARIIQLVENAQEQKAPTQRFLDEFEQKYALGVISLTALALVIPVVVLNQPFAPSFYRAMTLLVVASPCALIISVPAAILSAIANAARHGILFKGGAHLENLAGVKAIAFDKTGTLTGGKPLVTDLLPLAGQSQDELLALAAAVEARSEHPLAQAIVKEARSRGLTLDVGQNFEAISGRGARAELSDGRTFEIGSPEMFQAQLARHPEIVERVQALQADGKTTMLLGEIIRRSSRSADQPGDALLHGIVAVADQPRPEAREAIRALQALGIEHIIMLTGDNERVAQAIAGQIGVAEYQAGLLPEDKVRYVQALGEKYGAVAMIGDGVNDAPALAAASVGVAMGAAGTDVALETADVVLMSDDLLRLAYVMRLSRRSQRIIWQNIAFALGVIVVLVLANFIVGVPLPLGVIGHEGSTLIVVANGLRLLR